MKSLQLTTGLDPAAVAGSLEVAWGEGRLVGVAAPAEQGQLAAALGDPRQLGRFGAGVVVASGGSCGGRRWCLQPLAHLSAAAAASGRWLERQGIDPTQCLHLDPLPLHHVSGLMPLVRARRWGAELRWLSAELLRQPAALPHACPLPGDRPVLLSLVPTQLHRLMASPAALAWLGGCSVIWVGGAALPRRLAEQARQAGLALAPCYGATETAAMVCALPPRRFLAGEQGCGDPLDDVALRIDPGTSAVEVRTARLSPGWLEDGVLRPLPCRSGNWWRSGDGGWLGPDGLVVKGRLDGAILSGGETVFPEQLELRLQEEAARHGLPLEAVLLLPWPDEEWGGRLVALVRCRGQDAAEGDDDGAGEGAGEGERLLQALREVVASWPAAERPRSWTLCPDLIPNRAGKWERPRWRQWLIHHHPALAGG